jgi:hypothetical protein
MRITLLLQAPAALDARARLNRSDYLAWEEQAAKAQPARMALLSLDVLAGQGSPILCASQPAAVATAQRIFPDRRIEVKSQYREPALHPPALPGRWRPGTWRRLSLIHWMLRPEVGEAAEEARRRVIDSTGRLIGLAKEHDEAVLIAGPALLRLVAFKLNGLGFRGPLFRPFKPGVQTFYTSELPSRVTPTQP